MEHIKVFVLIHNGEGHVFFQHIPAVQNYCLQLVHLPVRLFQKNINYTRLYLEITFVQIESNISAKHPQPSLEI